MNNILNKNVSVICPCFNYAHYLGECLDSLLKQTYQIHEIIVVDDGGTDNCKEVCDKYIINEKCSVPFWNRPYPRLIYLRKENGGLASARNAGIKEATGEYLVCLDADDKLVPGAIEEQVRLMINDKTIAQIALMEFGDRFVVMIPTKPTGLERLLRSNTIFCNAMFSKRMWQEVGGYDESEIMRNGYEDWEFFIRLLAAGCEVSSSDFIGLRYRVHEGQMTQGTTRKNDKELRNYIKEKHKDLYERFNLLDNL